MEVNDYPDFSSHGYQIIRELGCNQEGGRITYLASDINQNHQVVIKEFRFALVGSNWSGFKAYQREIAMMQQLNHPRIPRYLDSFETPAGFCLVQEYKNAPSLAVRRSFTPQQIKGIAVSVLEILVYLQQQTPPVIHRDIKPENILVDKQFKTYLIDFGFARVRGGELALSSLAAGTSGFMPPEEQFGRPLTEASDLYSLGATLICLLTGTRSLHIGKLIDDDYRFDFKKLVPQLSPSLISWLEKMVAANVKQRFENAAVALEALKPIRVVSSATGEISVASLEGIVLRTLLGLGSFGIFTGLIAMNLIPKSVGPVTQLRGTYPGSIEQDLENLQLTKQCLNCNLRNANLAGADLSGADLAGANLSGANLAGARMPDGTIHK